MEEESYGVTNGRCAIPTDMSGYECWSMGNLPERHSKLDATRPSRDDAHLNTIILNDITTLEVCQRNWKYSLEQKS